MKKIILIEEGSTKKEIQRLTDHQWQTLRAGRDVTIRQRGYAGHKYHILLSVRGNVCWSPCGNLGGGSGRWEEA